MSTTQERIAELTAWRSHLLDVIQGARELEKIDFAPGTPEHNFRRNILVHVLPHARECLDASNAELAELAAEAQREQQP